MYRNTYAINEGNWGDFPIQIREYIAFCKQSDLENKLPYKTRYVGSMVADIHRTLLQGEYFYILRHVPIPKVN